MLKRMAGGLKRAAALMMSIFIILSQLALPVAALAQDVTMLRVVGAQYPIAEKSDYRTKSYEISAAFVSEGDCNAFENLLGRVVCVKDQFKSIVVGVMSAQSKAITQFFTMYDAVVQQIDYVPEV